MDPVEHDHHASRPGWRSRWLLIAFLAFAGFLLWTDHRDHALGVLPYLLILACPLMHLFHHHRHGHHHGHTHQTGRSADRSTPVEEVRHEQ